MTWPSGTVSAKFRSMLRTNGISKLSCGEAPSEHCVCSQSAAERDLLDFASEVIGMAEQQCREEGSGALTPCVYLQGPCPAF